MKTEAEIKQELEEMQKRKQLCTDKELKETYAMEIQVLRWVLA